MSLGLVDSFMVKDIGNYGTAMSAVSNVDQVSSLLIQLFAAFGVGGAKSCVCHSNPQALYQLTSGKFSVSDVEQQEWVMPAGAFHGAAGGPC